MSVTTVCGVGFVVGGCLLILSSLIHLIGGNGLLDAVCAAPVCRWIGHVLHVVYVGLGCSSVAVVMGCMRSLLLVVAGALVGVYCIFVVWIVGRMRTAPQRPCHCFFEGPIPSRIDVVRNGLISLSSVGVALQPPSGQLESQMALAVGVPTAIMIVVRAYFVGSNYGNNINMDTK